MSDEIPSQEDYIYWLELIYEAQWSSYEEGGSIQIYADPNYPYLFHVREGLSSVYSDDPYWGELYEVQDFQVEELKAEWDIIVKQDEEYWNNNGGY